MGKNLNETEFLPARNLPWGTQSLPISPVSLHQMQGYNQVTWVFGIHYLKVHIGSIINTMNSGGRPSPTLYPLLGESGQRVPRWSQYMFYAGNDNEKFCARTAEEINLQLNTITKFSTWLYFGKYYLHRFNRPNILHCHGRCPTDCFLIS